MSSQLEQRLRTLEATLLVNQKDPWTHARIGHLLLELNRPDDALRSFSKVLELAPTLPEGHQGLGDVSAYRGDPSSALRYYAKALELNRSHVPTLSSLIRLHEQSNTKSEATPHYRTIITVKADDTTWQRRAALHFFTQGLPGEALPLLETLDAKSGTDPEITAARGICLNRLERREEAIAVLAPLCEAKLPLVDARVELASTYEQQRDFRSAYNEWKRLSDWDPTHQSAKVSMARAAIELGSFREALDILNLCKKTEPSDNRIISLESRAYLGLLDATTALTLARKGLEGDAADAELHLIAGKSLSLLTRHAEAIASLEKATRYAPDCLEAWLLLGELHAKMTQYEAACRAYESAVAIAPQNSEVHLACARFERASGQTTRSKTAYQRAFDCDNRATEAALGAAQCAYDLTAWEEAQLWLTRTLALSPALPSAVKLLGLVQLAAKDYRGAQATLETASSLTPKDAEIHEALADCHRSLGNSSREYESLERAFQLNEHTEMALRLGIAAKNLRRYERAQEVLSRGLSFEPNHALILLELGLTFEQLNRTAEARDALVRAARLSPGNPSTLLGLGRVCLKLNEPALAIGPLEQLLRIEPNSDEAQLLLASAYHREGALRDAAQLYRTLHESHPTDVRVAFSLSNVLADAQDRDLAYHYVLKAIALDPSHVEANKLAGKLALLNDKASLAAEHFRKAATLSPESVDVLEYLVQATAKANFHDESARIARQLLRLRPNSPEVAAQLARSSERLGNNAEADEAWLLARKLCPQNATFQIGHGRLLYQQKRYADCAQALKPALEQQTGEASDWELLAWSEERLNAFQASADALTQAIRLEPTADRFQRLGDLERTLHHQPKAIDAYTAAFELGMDSPTLRETLGNLLSSQADLLLSDNRPSEALKAVEASLRFCPESHVFLEKKGRLCYQLGDNEAALCALEKAQTLGCSNDSALLLLAQLAAQLGRHDVAERTYRTLQASSAVQRAALDGLLALYLHLGRTGEAIPLLVRSLELCPDHAEHGFLLGSLLHSSGRFGDALPHLKRAIKLRPTDGPLHHALSQCELAQGDKRSAIAAAQVALQLEPHRLDFALELYRIYLDLDEPQGIIDTLAHFFAKGELAAADSEQLGIALLRVQRPGDAIAPLEHALKASPREDLELKLLELYWATEQREQVIVSADAILKKSPRNARALELLASALALSTDRADLDRAISAYERLLSCDSAHTLAIDRVVHLRLSRAQNQTQSESKIADLSRALELAPHDATLHLSLASCLSQKGDYSLAYRHVRESINLCDSDVQGWLLRGDLEKQNKQLALAETSFERALQLSPSSVDALSRLAQIALEKGNESSALAYFEKLCTEQPTNETFHLEALKLCQSLGDTANATRHLDAVSCVRKLSAPEQRKLALLLAENKNHAEATKQLTLVVAADPSDVEAAFQLALSLIAQGQDCDAIGWLERLIRIAPNHPNARRELGLALVREGRFEAALSMLQAAREVCSTDAEVLNGLVQCFHAQRQLTALRDVLQTLTELEPTDTDHWEQLAKVSLDLDDPQAAILALEQTVTLGGAKEARSQLFELLIEQADLLITRREIEPAVEAITKASRHASDESLRQLACVRRLSQIGAIERAIEIALRAKELENGFDVNLLLGQAWLKKGAPGEATVCLERALELRIDSPAALLALGQAQLDLGNWQEAETALGRAKHLAPSDNSIDTLLSRLYLQRGRTSDALSALRRVIASEPQNITAKLELAELLEQSQEHTECIAVLTSVPDHLHALSEQGATLLAAAYDVTKQWPHLLELAQARLLQNPSGIAWWMNQAKAYAAIGQLQQACDSMEKAHELAPQDHLIRLQLAELYEQLSTQSLAESRSQLAAQAAERALALGSTSPNLLHVAAQSQRNCNNLHRARELSEQAVSTQPSFETWLLLAQLELAVGRFAQAERAYQGALNQNRDSAETWLELAKARRSDARITDALAAAEEAVRLRKSVEGLTLLTELLENTNERARRIQAYEQLERLRPLTLREKVQQAKDYLAQDGIENAIAAFEDAIEMAPSDVTLLLALSEAHLRSNKTSSAISVLEKALRIAPNDLSVMVPLAQASFQAKDFERALSLAQLAHSRAPTANLLQLIANSHSALGHFDLAAQALEESAKDSQKSAADRLEIARLYAEGGQRDKAIAVLEQVYRDSSGTLGAPDLVPLLLDAADQATAAMQPEKCLQYLDRAEQIKTSDPVLLDRLATLLESVGYGERAMRVLETAHATTHLPTALTLKLARLQAQAGRFGEALISFEQANSADLDCTEALMGVVKCRLELNQAGRAVPPLLQALGLRPTDPELTRLVHRTMSQLPTGELRREMLERALHHRPDDPELRLALARDFLSLQKFENAERTLCDRVCGGQASHESLLVLAEAQELQGKLQQSLASYRKALELAPNDSATRVKVGKLQAQAGDRAEAIISLESAYAVAPTAELSGMLSRLYEEESVAAETQGDLERAVVTGYQSLRRRDDKSALCLRIAKLQGTLGRHSDAIETLRLAISGTEADANTWALMGDHASILGRHDLAAEAYENAQRLLPDDENLCFRLGAALAKIDNRSDVIAFAERLLRNNQLKLALSILQGAKSGGMSTLELHELLAACALRQGDRAGYLAALRARVAVQPSRALVHIELADALIEQGLFDEAIESLTLALKTELQPEALRRLSQCYAATHKPVKRLEALSQLLDLEPNNAALHAELGLVRLAMGHDEAAQDALETALSISPDLATAREPFRLVTMKLARRYASEQPIEAIRYYDALTKLPDCTAELLVECANCQLCASQLDAAIESLKRATKLAPSQESITLRLGSLLMQRGKLEEAIAVYAQAHAINPTSMDLSRALANAYESQGNYHLGAEALRQVVYSANVEFELVLYQIHLLACCGRYEDAIQRCNAAIPRFPGRPELLQRLGTLHAELGNHQDSIQALRQAASMEPSHPSRFYLLARFLLNQMQHAEAAQWLEEGLRRHPSDASLSEAYLYCAQTAEAAQDYRLASNLYRQYLAICPPSVPALRGLASSLVMLGQSERACSIYEQAIQFEPRNAQLRFDLGSLYASLRRMGEAHQHWEILRQLDPNLGIRLAQLLGT